MADRQAVLDETSVPPVSSLRSKFESLGTQLSHGRPALPKASSILSTRNAIPPAIPRKPPLHDRSIRPVSMIEHQSPQSVLLQPDDQAQPRSSFDDRGHREELVRGRDFLSADHASRREQEAVIGQAGLSKAQQNGNGNFKADPIQTTVPPARPQVPHKKPTLSTRFSEKRADMAVNEPAKVAATPLMTQPDSPEVVSALKARQRMNSDASWVERLRADSDASSHFDPADIFRDGAHSPEKTFMKGRRSPKKLTRSSRVQSNASWVETLSPDSPMSVADERTQHQLARTTTEPDIPEEMPRLPPRPTVEDNTDIVRSRSLAKPAVTRQIIQPEAKPVATVAAPTSALQRRVEAAPLHKQGTALSQGFGRQVPSQPIPSSTASLVLPPVVPAPRRSLDRRRELVPDKLPVLQNTVAQPIARTTFLSKVDSDASLSEKSYEAANLTFPDISAYNRRPPTWRQRPSQIHTEYDTRLLAVSGNYVCTSGFITRVWDVRTGEQLMNVIHPENFKVTAIAFKSAPLNTDSTRIWLGTNLGEMHELDIKSQRIIDTSQRAHKGREIIKIYAQRSQLWSLDTSGNLAVWKTGKDGSPSLQTQFQLFHTQRGHNASIVCGGLLWIAAGKDIRIYRPTATNDADFQAGHISMVQMNMGEITSVATVETQSDLIHFGHTDGKISICSRQTLRCTSTVHVSLNKIGNLFGIGQYLWTGYGTGTMQVYDTAATPWKTTKEWSAHSKQIASIACDVSSPANGIRVVTLGADNIIKLWDGLLEDDWVEERLHAADSSFCDFSEITTSVLTWNAGASKPSHLQRSIEDDNFLRDYIAGNAHSDIFVFGFQELVDLEDKKLTAKSFFKSKKKDAFEQEHMTHQYRAWRDHLTSLMQGYAGEDYTTLHTASMIGLFTCVFVKTSIRQRIKHVHQAEVKRGMGGLHGNKGALILRMVLDDSSICLINCHLAAGQSQTSSRNNDAAAILEAESLPAWPLEKNSKVEHADVFTSGGDGSAVLDHELCILNGDLNYRIDTMSRDTVVKQVEQGNLVRLLDRDQLLLSRKKNPGFKLRALQERQIQFRPTYKYNVNSNEYDTSEKRRSPAWCDRVLYRGPGKIKCEEYRRWEVRVSDHRPVSALFTCRVKRIDTARQAQVLQQCLNDFVAYKQEILAILRAGER